MAGGVGRRLAPYTSVLPKPLMPLTDRPIIDVILRQLEHAGIESVQICVGHLGSLIESWIRQQPGYDVPISFVYEDEPLGTAGALAMIDGLEGTFLAMNGDILTSLSFADLVRRHEESKALATVSIKERTVEVEYGVVHVDADGHIERLEEKPTISFTVSMGVYAFDAAIVELIARGERVDFPDLLVRAMSSGNLVSTYRYEGYWRDIGSRDDYTAAIADFEEAPERFVP